MKGRRQVIGRSVQGRTITAYEFGPRKALCTLIIGGVHGDEPKGVYVARKLIELLQSDELIPVHSRVVVVPILNPDGFRQRKRRNAHGVDLNRNFPTENWVRGSARRRFYGGPAPASEPETVCLIRLVHQMRACQIVTIHSIDKHRHCNNYDGAGYVLALRLRRSNGYPIRRSIGYPTPGSFGTWAGIERGIPMVTLELPSHHSRERCWVDNREGLIGVMARADRSGRRSWGRAVRECVS